MKSSQIFTLKQIFIVVIILLVIVLNSCESEGKTSTESPDFYWETDVYGDFHTNSWEKAQEQIPFDLVIPSYLPTDIDKKPYIKAPLKSNANEVTVLIKYRSVDEMSGNSIHIDEFNGKASPGDPSLNPGLTEKEIAGVQIIESEHTIRYKPPSGDAVGVQGFVFLWQQKDVFLDVGIYGYEYDEAVKIIESLIQQK